MTTYTHGHHESVLRSHRWRTAENSAAYLLPHLRRTDALLDVGCGPGTLTADLAGRVGSVHALEQTEQALDLAWVPESVGLTRWMELYQAAATANGGEPQAGRRLLSWARQAGLTDVWAGSSTWCFAAPEDRQWWGGMWADRIQQSALASQLLDTGLATQADLQQVRDAWLDFAAQDSSWLSLLHGEVLVRVP
jgi:hypothetical protein